MPIPAKNVYDRVTQLAKDGTSGYQNQDEYNSKTYSAELTLTELLVNVDETNGKVTDALNWMRKSSDLTSDTTGLVALPGDYYHFRTVQYKTPSQLYPAQAIRTNEIGMVRTSPVRGMNVAKNKVGYYFQQGGLYVLPEQVLNIRLTYIKQPVFSVATFTPVSNDEQDYINFAGTNFGWPEYMFNLLVFLILEQLGIEQKEGLLTEFSAYGINREVLQ